MPLTPAPFYIGIDLAWAEGNPSGVAVLDGEARLVAYNYAETVEAILDVVRAYPGCRVGVDAPMIIPNATGHRPNELQFLKTFARYGLGVHAVNTQLFEKRFKRYAGFALYEGLEAEGIGFEEGTLFEVYPHATILALFNGGKVLRYKASAPRETRLRAMAKLQTALFEVLTLPNSLKTPLGTLRGKALKAEEDFLDSLVCAYTLCYAAEKRCLTFGDAACGVLLTPPGLTPS
ncbi:DUF429 domain-containing protein [Sulfurimonas sp. HSL-3221]|uniref:DUF429 domain-containing protein n=1 Tax=Sulfurimonadaceae TaxID=2771471 RepID=UPI001E4F8C87|nr:DUF429 domain-containing protein [Sulfurimonas sp. HSL-3221]UFS62554.1 DUF429 domain-containing protein [Sulfurimonas sp. HSL-3221]